jgi:hypothetical protein
MRTICTVRLWAVALVWVIPALAADHLAQRIAHTDPAKYTTHQAVHAGPGQMKFMVLLDGHALDTNLLFVHRGVLEAKSGIGAHFHSADGLFRNTGETPEGHEFPCLSSFFRKAQRAYRT